ncbi:hypothetical protein AJ80_02113 [Polytolypa hystricis UAMH7299]|uniref:Xylanolytic transcriptional activator regulatory domain-containing protein n=1 Tax=Polytolypa hystricis (strain UAMH7299) TaxID=1447883 RepID=A0A2B7YRC2_POLH7|nr:hypothetical protein AJ80_02113 [Polytolypa hystricis UAMH7299]
MVIALVNNKADTTGSTPSNTANSPEVLSVPSQLGDSAGRLSVDEDGTNYVGSSHWKAIMNEIADVKEDVKGLDILKQTEPTDDRDSLDHGVDLLLGVNKYITKQELLASIPPRHVVDRLISRFHNSMEMSSMAIHTPTFYKEYEQFWKDPPSTSMMWVSTLFSMMCLSTYFQLLAGTYPDLPQKIEQDTKFYRQRSAQCLAFGNYTKPSAHTLPALMLYFATEHIRRNDADFGLSILLGVLVRTAMRMGCHRDASHYPHISVFEGEMRRRMWTIIVQIDLLISFQFGLPRVINEQQADCQPPRNLLDQDFDPDTKELPPARPDTEASPASFAITRTNLLLMFGKIMDIANSTHQPAYDTIMKLDLELHRLFESVPSHYKMLEGAMSDIPQSIPRRLTVESIYQKSRCVLHRKYLTLPGSQYSYSRDTCVSAAMNMLGHQALIYRESQPGGKLHSGKWKISSFIHHDFLLAAMIVCVDVERGLKEGDTTSPQGTPGRNSIWTREEKLQALKDAYKIWKSSKFMSGEAEKAARILNVVIGKCEPASSMQTQVSVDDEQEAGNPMSDLPMREASDQYTQIDAGYSQSQKPFAAPDAANTQGNFETVPTIPDPSVQIEYNTALAVEMSHMHFWPPSALNSSDPFIEVPGPSIDWVRLQ